MRADPWGRASAILCLTPILLTAVYALPHSAEPSLALARAGGLAPAGCGSVGTGTGCGRSPGSTGQGPIPSGSPQNDGALAWSAVAPPLSTTGGGAGMASYSPAQETVLFGGSSGYALLNATQLYNESTNAWTTLSPPTAPSPRANFAFASNDSAGTAVLFGGEVDLSTGQVDNSTWSFDFATGDWTNLSGPGAPPAREASAFAIDPAAGVGLLFGGWNPDYTGTSAVIYDDLWAFHFASDTWTELTPAGARPPPLQGAMLAYSGANGVFLLYGGCFPCSSDVWSFSLGSGAWTELGPPSGSVPPPRESASWALDPVSGEYVLFGGTNGESAMNDTWLFNASADVWALDASVAAPSPRVAPASAWLNVSGNETLLLSGGANGTFLPRDLWRLAPTATLEIEVWDQPGGVALGGAQVVIDGGPPLSTNRSGDVDLSLVNPIETTIGVSHLGFADQDRAFWLAPDSVTVEYFGLDTVAPADLSVLVVSNETGAPRPGATIALQVAGQTINESSPETDGLGYANFTGVPTESPAPNATLTVTAVDNYSTSQTFPLAPGASVDRLVNLTAYAFLHLSVVGVLATDVIVPLVHAIVLEGTASIGETTAAGWLNVSSARPGGNVSWSVSAPGFAGLTETKPLPATGDYNHTFQLEGYPFGKIAASTFDGSTATLIAGAIVTASANLSLSSVNYTATGETSITGVTTLRVPQGFYNLTANAYGYYPSSLPGSTEVAEDASVGVSFNMTLLPGANINVEVRGADQGPPLPGARVLMGALAPVSAGRGGWANFTNVHFGPTLLNVTDPGYFNNTTLIVFDPEEVIAEYLVNLTPLPGSHGLGNGSTAFGSVLPDLTQLAPYFVVVAALVVGGLVYLLLARVAPVTGNGRPEDEEPPPPGGA